MEGAGGTLLDSTGGGLAERHRVAADPASVERAAALLDRFMGSRTARTRRAYGIDVHGFARYLGCDAAEAVARLLRCDGDAGRRLAMEYAAELRQKGRASATIVRRLATLRAVVRAAHEAGMVTWQLDVPGESQVTSAIDEHMTTRVPYLLPRHPSEIHRLDVQHYALQASLGRSYLAPVEAPARVLDAGCGTGQWGFELCEQHPSALVVGVDLVPGKPERPAGYRWVRANLLSGLPLVDRGFDFVHQRFLVSGIPLVRWPSVVAELFRVTRPGGWIELTESVMNVEDLGPASGRLIGLAQSMSAALGLDTGTVVCDSLHEYVRGAGAVDVERREVQLPIGRWGGDVGALVATDMRSACSRLCEVLQARGQLTPEESHQLLHDAQEEWEERHTRWTVAIVWGRRPG